MLWLNKLQQLSLLLYIVFITLGTVIAKDNEIARIELVGTITGKYALAIIRIDNKTEGIYQLQQNMLGYTIDDISKNSIVLTKNSLSTSVQLVAVKTRQFYGTTANTTTSSLIPTYVYRIHRNTLLSLQHDQQSWLDNMRFTLILDNGYLAGYKVTYIHENSPAALLGLGKGDIITGINGLSIRYNNADFIKIIGQLQQSSDFTLNMRHSKNPFNLKFIIDKSK